MGDIHTDPLNFTQKMYELAKEGYFISKVTTKEKDGRIVEWNYIVTHNETKKTRKVFVKQYE